MFGAPTLPHSKPLTIEILSPISEERAQNSEVRLVVQGPGLQLEEKYRNSLHFEGVRL